MICKKPIIYSPACGSLSILLALSVMFGWHTDNQDLIQVSESFAPIQYNTALGFLLCGIGLIALFYNKTIFTRLLGIVTLILGAATLVQYVLNINLGIDEFLMEPDVMTKTSHPGRPSPLTAICFMLCGGALCATAYNRAIIISAASSVLIICLLALFGYLIQNNGGGYGWENLSHMAIHTVSGFVIIAVGLGLDGLYGWGQKQFDFWKIFPFSIAVIVGILTFFSWSTIDKETQARNEAYIHGLIQDTQTVLLDRYQLYEHALLGGVGLYYASEKVERNAWTQYVNTLDVQRTLPGTNGIGYIDYILSKDLESYLERTRADAAPDFQNKPDTFYPDKFIIKYIEPEEDNLAAIGLDVGFEANRRAAAERARDLGVPALTKKITLVQDNRKQAGFLLLVPVYKSKNTPPNITERRKSLQGWVYAPFIGPNFFKDVGTINKNQLSLSVFDGKKAVRDALIYSDADNSDFFRNDIDTKIIFTNMKIAGRNWTLAWQKNKNFAPPANQNLALILFVLGMVFSVLLYFTLGRLLHSKDMIRKKVQVQTQELKEASDFQDLIVNTIPDFVFIKDSEFRIIQANEAFLSLYMNSNDETIIGKTCVEDHAPEEAEEFLKHDKIALKKGYSEVEEIITFSDGVSRTLLTKKVRFANAKNDVFILGISRDITEAKKAEEQIKTTNFELTRSNKELERFAYIASHDLQEPLRRIGGFTERLEKHLGKHIEGDERATQYMEFITSGVVRMRELIKGLLEYSRVTTSEDDMQDLDTNEIVHLAIDALSETILENNAQVFYEDLPEVFYDKVMLTQLFQNLIGNGIKYRSERDPEIHIKAKQRDGFWEFSVQDNGMGMDKKYFTRIFDMFQRLHRKEEIDGTGIGLSLCQKIVERYGGTIWVTSKLDEGSTFFFTIPIKKD